MFEIARKMLETCGQAAPFVEIARNQRRQGLVLPFDMMAESPDLSRPPKAREVKMRAHDTQRLAADLGFERMEFLNMSVAESTQADFMPAQFDVVTALHACDTATDDAIAFGLEKKARAMVLVPCCQAEVAACLRQTKALSLARTPLAELWRHPIHTREMGSQITNVLRCLHLEASGYQVTVTELVGWEHSMKNELIIARYTGQKKRSAVERLAALLDEFGLRQSMGHRFGLEAEAALS